MENNITENKSTPYRPDDIVGTCMGFKWVYLIGFFLILTLPLWNLPPWFSPPDWGKTIVFKIVLSILIFLFICQLFLEKDFLGKIRQKISSFSIRSPFWILLTLLGVFFLANLLSQEPYFSFWGNPHRSGGFLNFAFYIAFALLAFFILKDRYWKKIWIFNIAIGILVSFIAIFQLYGLFENILIPFSGRPPSTIGGPIFLAIYLLLLTFLTLIFGIKEKLWPKRIFYFSSLLLFLFTALIVTQTRAVFVGLLIGFLYFFLFYPTPKIKLEENSSQPIWSRTILLQTLAKIVIGLILISGVYGIYYINNTPELPQFIQENELLKPVATRLSIETALEDSRISGWKVGWQALKDKPFIGYGPENFSIGFDKYYDPTLPKITYISMSWWDRAHNFFLETPITTGIPSLIIFLSLFAVLFYELQKLKKKKTENLIIYHGIQATFLAYLAANFFSFDTFSTYLISFLLIGYSLHLIHNANILSRTVLAPTPKFLVWVLNVLEKYRVVILGLLFIVLVWFIWFNISAFQVNKNLKLAEYYSKEQNFQKSFNYMEEAYSKHSFINNYAGLKYIDVISAYFKNANPSPQEIKEKTNKAIEILRKNTEIRPNYARSWLLLGAYINISLETEKLSPEEFKKLKQEADSALEKAHQLSPKRQEIIAEWIKTDLLSHSFQQAKERAQMCIDINPKFKDCYWMMALTQVYLNNIEQANEDMKLASKKGYPVKNESSLLQLSKAYYYNKNYEEMVTVYEKLIKQRPNYVSYHLNLAILYKETGKYKEAKKQALKVIELDSNFKPQAEEFLRTLPI